MAANSDEILHDFSPMLRAYKDGRIERLTGEEIVPASVDPTTGVQSKDVEISPEINVSARLYLPGNANPSKKLPLLVYFHGGGFLIESAFSPLYQKHLNHLVAEANVVAVSVNYRLAPEHPLPIAYDDSWLALNWVAAHSRDEGNENWIKDFADFDRVFLSGDSAGGNVAHNIAMRAGSEKLDGINLSGVILNCPFFLGGGKSVGENLWQFVCPGTTGFDDPWINPGTDPKLSNFGCRRVLVYVGEKDFLRDVGWYYKEVLIKSEWDGEIELVDVEGEDHVFSVFYPESEKGIAMLKKVASFINQWSV